MAVITGLMNQYNAATGDSTLINRVEIAVLNAAQAVATEGSGATNHVNRVAWAKAVSQPGASANYAAEMAKLVYATTSLDLGAPGSYNDANIQTAVNACVNTQAGAP